jgi:fatty acid desaturase
VYAYGLGSLTVLAAALRAIGEHQVGADEPVIQGEAALRNLRCNVFTRLLLGAYGFGEHATHHAHPGVPYYWLPDLTRDLARTNANMVPKHGYLGTIRRLVRSPFALKAAGPV